tara:strand:+ start:3343 stop:6009 length:2667 start_codon:yes stop_codon:yes gene_type:complete
MGLGMPIPDLSNKPGPGRPGWSAGTYDFQFEVTGAVTIKAQPAATGQSFTIKWPNGTEQTTTGSNSIAAPDGTAGIVSINKKTDNTYADEFAVVGGQTNVSKVISWGQNPWSNMTQAFNGCTSLSDISTTSFISSTQGDMVRMFNGCTSLLEADIKNWDLTAGADWYGGSPFRGLVNLQKLDMTGLNVKVISRADNAFSGIGTAVTDGCEFLMSGLNMSTSTATITPYWFDSCRIKPTSNFSNWIFNPNGFDGTGMFRSIQLTGTNSILNCSGWSTYSGSKFPSFQSSNSGAGNTGAKVNLTNLNLSNTNNFATSFQSTDFSGIIGLSTWGATAGNVSMYRAFYVAEYFKFSNSDNFSSTFIQSLTPTGNGFTQVFDRTGTSLAYDPANGIPSDFGDAPNLSNINLSGVSGINQTFTYAKFKNVPDIASATFNSSGVSFYELFLGARFSDANSHFDFSNTTVKLNGNCRRMTESAWLSNITFGNNVDFSTVTDMYRSHYNMRSSATGDTTQPVTIKYPTAGSGLSWAALTQPLDWFRLTTGPTTGPLTTCQVDNLIRSFHNTALNSGLTVDFSLSKITEAPSVVQAQEAELVANGWTITANSTDATLPFAYPSYSFDSEVTQSVTPTTVPTGGQFSSTDPGLTVDQNTGVVSWDSTYMGLPIIRCTYADGCYNEVQMSMIITVDNNYSMEFEGTSSYIDCGNSDDFSFGNSTTDSGFSISAWINMDDATRFRIANKYNNPGSKEYIFTTSGSDLLSLNLYDSSSSGYIGRKYNTALTSYQGQWIHVACTYDGTRVSSGIKLYLNGVKVDDIDNNSGNYTAMENTTVPFRIAQQSGTYSNGKIDELSVFNRELTPAQVKLIYDANSTNKSIKLSNLPGGAPVAWYRMGD